MKNIKLFCIQISDNLFRKKHRGIEHRKFIRLKDSISLAIRLVDSYSEKIYSRQIIGKTLNISKEGLCIETSTVTVDGVDIFNDAMSDEKSLDIEIDAYKGEDNIKAFGKVVWLDMTPQQKSFLFKAGVFLNIKDSGDVNRWYNLVENAKKYSKEKSWFLRVIQKLFK